MSRKEYRPLSLAQHFDPPAQYAGQFGWLCGYSADAMFLDHVVERFTEATHARRAAHGKVALAVFLDPGNPQVSAIDAPGVAHLPIRNPDSKPFRLLHAKVALLGFRHQEKRHQWCLRLLVSTGNWTRQTLEESLDLVWRIDLFSDQLDSGEDLAQDCADIRAAWDLLSWTQTYFDTRLLGVSLGKRADETRLAREEVETWISRCAAQAGKQTRFFDNRKKSLLDQLPKLLRDQDRVVTRNYLAMGSGFFETVSEPGRLPEIPQRIRSSLVAGGLLTRTAEVDIFVNPKACQSIAVSVGALNDEHIAVRPAAAMQTVFRDSVERSLHAKFLFSANYRESSNICSSAWVYLGSGNLTAPGFARKMSPKGGNLEAGVVFSPKDLHWHGSNRHVEPGQVVTNLLPIQFEAEVTSEAVLAAGSGMETRDFIFVAAPLAYLFWHQDRDAAELQSGQANVRDVDVLNPDGAVCERTATGFAWEAPRPRQVRIRWKDNGTQHEQEVPVIDEYGRIAASALAALDVEAAWWQLADFPAPPETAEEGDAELDEHDADGDGAKRHSGEFSSRVEACIYPVRQMMQLVEGIAARQVEIDEADWALWCSRLEQTLCQMSGCTAVQSFLDMELNPLESLRLASSRPIYAEYPTTQAGRLYEEVLERIEASWGVANMSVAGENV